MHLEDPAEETWTEVYPGVRRWARDGARITVTTYRFGPGGRFPRHRHVQEQAVILLRGSITFRSSAQALTLKPGNLLIIPAEVPHEAVAGRSGAALWSVVSPARRSQRDYTVLRARARRRTKAKGER